MNFWLVMALDEWRQFGVDMDGAMPYIHAKTTNGCQ
jgi:hypothetical protein